MIGTKRCEPGPRPRRPDRIYGRSFPREAAYYLKVRVTRIAPVGTRLLNAAATEDGGDVRLAAFWTYPTPAAT